MSGGFHALLARVIASALPPWSPLSWFAAGEQGAWYDPSDLLRYTVGGAETISNGTFASDVSGWTSVEDWVNGSWSGGAASVTTNASYQGLAQAIAGLTVGATYALRFVILPGSVNGRVYVGPVARPATFPILNLAGLAPGTYVYTFVATGTSHSIGLSSSSASAGPVFYDNVSVRELPEIATATMFQDSAGTTPVTAVEQPVGRILDKSGRGNHALQATSTARPTLRNRYNLLTFSEQFANVVWGRTNIQGVTNDVIAAPDGAVTADLLVPNTTSGTHFLTNAATAGSAGPHTLTIRVKPGGYSRFGLREQSNGTVEACFDLSGAGTVLAVTGATASVSIAALDDGWYLITATSTLLAASSYRLYVLPEAYTSGALNTYSWSGDGTSGLYLWGASLATAADTSLPYQRIAAATDYDSDATKFPLYLAFDGNDDSLATGAVDFAGAENLSLVAGMTRNTAGISQIMVESSAVWSSNAGAFILGVNGADGAAFGARGSGSTVSATVTSGYAIGDKKIVTGVAALADDSISLRLNGTVVNTQTQDRGTDGLLNYPIFIGRRNSSSGAANMRLYQLIIRGAASPDIAQAEGFVAGKAGVAL
jgi:hypothetical protein